MLQPPTLKIKQPRINNSNDKINRNSHSNNSNINNNSTNTGNSSNNSNSSNSNSNSNSNHILIHVEDQPTGNVVANKYLEPAILIRADQSLLPLCREGKLQATASLCLALTDEPLSRTIDNKQDILQGNTVISFTSEGYAAFPKLKIMEVSSKHHHQAFSIQMQLLEISVLPDGSTTVTPFGEPTKLAPLHVQSRINKRKHSTFSSGRPKKRVRGEAESNYVDITPLLVLPQKEAANRLGISESMLCKRFKECTRRKWPYRYLRKIDKMILSLSLNKKSELIPREDLEKIQKLKKEREECLHPVKIRITGHDKNMKGVVGVEGKKGSESESEGTESNSGSPDEEDGEREEEEGEGEVEVEGGELTTTVAGVTHSEEGELAEEDDEITQVASTLNLLKKGAF